MRLRLRVLRLEHFAFRALRVLVAVSRMVRASSYAFWLRFETGLRLGCVLVAFWLRIGRVLVACWLRFGLRFEVLRLRFAFLRFGSAAKVAGRQGARHGCAGWAPER